MNNNLKGLLDEYKTLGEFYTHVSMINPKGKYSIGRQGIEQFFKEYCKFVYPTEEDAEIPVIGIAENPYSFLPVLADVDIKIAETESYELGEQIYEDEQLQNTVKIYQDVLQTIIKDCKPENLYCFVLEKESYLVKTEKGNFVKNGFHLHFPHTFLNKMDIEKHLFPRVQKQVREKKIFSSLGFEDSGELIDKDAALNKCWLMYGSRKEGENMKPYMLTRIYDQNLEEMTLEDALENYKVYNSDERTIKIAGKEWYYLPRILSINPKNRQIQDVKDNLEILTKARTRKPPTKDKKVEKIDAGQAEKEAEYICLNLLSRKRAENYGDWLNTMWAIHAVTNGSDNGLEIFLNFSKRCPEKYSEDECILAWERTEEKTDGFTIASLYFWAKCDNETEYMKWKKSKAEKYIQESLTTAGSHYDIAKALCEMYGDKFVCSSIQHNEWYKFENHIWERDQEGTSLRNIISEDLAKIYKESLREAYNAAIDADDEGEKAKWSTRSKILEKIVNNLKSSPFKTNIMKECKEVFFDPVFNKLKDRNKYLIAFKNGVYDLKNKIFRPGMPNDRITLALGPRDNGVKYVEYKEEDDKVQFIYRFLEKIFPDKSIREYFLDVSSEIFVGGNKRKKVYFWSGEGDNGKSVTQNIFEAMLGPLAIKLPTSLVTSKRGQSSSAAPELVRAGNGVRWAVLQEPDKRDVLNIGILKELSGNDTFFARGLYQEGGEINPMFKVVVICNEPPLIPYSDKATWNRIRVIPFESKFSDNAPETFEEQMRTKVFPVDREFDDRIPEMLEPFAWLLINHRNKERPHREPEKVTLATEYYRKNNDVYRQFVEECLIEEEDKKSYISLPELYDLFKDWYKDGMPGHQIPNKNEVKEYFIKFWGPPVKSNKWKGYRVKNNKDEIELTEKDLVQYDEVELPL